MLHKCAEVWHLSGSFRSEIGMLVTSLSRVDHSGDWLGGFRYILDRRSSLDYKRSTRYPS